MLNELRDGIHKNAIEKGWHETERTETEYKMLFCSEIFEAFEEYRKFGDYRIYYSYNRQDKADCLRKHDYMHCNECVAEKGTIECYAQKPEGVAVELIDVVIRILDYCGRYEIDIDAEIDDLQIRDEIEANFTRFLKDMTQNLMSCDLKRGVLSYTICQIMIWFENNSSQNKKLDFMYLIKRKMNYNSIRPVKHGNKVL